MSNIAYMSACVSMSGFCHGSSDSRPPDAAGRLRPPHGQLSAGVRASENNREGELLQMDILSVLLLPQSSVCHSHNSSSPIFLQTNEHCATS